jgi:hypothetical protein
MALEPIPSHNILDQYPQAPPITSRHRHKHVPYESHVPPLRLIQLQLAPPKHIRQDYMQLRMRQMHPHASPRPFHKRHQIPGQLLSASVSLAFGKAGWRVQHWGFRVIEPALGDEGVGIWEEDFVVVHTVVVLRHGGSRGDGVGAVF